MLKRKIYDKLIAWKQLDDRKSLIINGARQVGKTYIVREFGKAQYESFVELNFVEHPEYKRIFDESLDVESLLMNISVYVPGIKLIPEKTLILFDEIQECSNAITALKFWTENAEYDVIATGSGLGMNYRQESSYPVGKVQYEDMYALDFIEFLWGLGIDEMVIDKVKDCLQKRVPVPQVVHEKMNEYLKLYMVVGGMPDVVNTYIQSKDLSKVDEVQRRIYRDYIIDIAHYASPEVQIKAEKCYRSIPIQLSKENHKFQYSQVESKGTANKFGSSLDWLVNAYMVKPVYSVKRIEYPLKAYVDETNFRMYPTDIGLLVAGYDFQIKRALLEDGALEEKSTNLLLGTVKGALYEALAADMLVKKGIVDLYFYKDVKSTMEIEYLIVKDEGIVPIEIKAGRKKANSLDNLLATKSFEHGYKFASQNVGVNGKKITLPMYMLAFDI